jgi:PAS domain S-box-containing protein
MHALDAPARLAALRATGLLDTHPTGAFDHLTRLATRLLGVPASVVTLVEVERQVFVGGTGLSEPVATTRETPIRYSLCQHIVRYAQPLVVDNANRHDLVRDNPSIREHGVVAYAGVPLVTSDGHVLGGFCAFDTAPRGWSESDLGILRDLAAAAMTEAELRVSTRTLMERDAQIASLFDLAGELVCATDLEGRFTYANRAWQQRLGYSLEEAKGLHATHLVPPEHRARFGDMVKSVLGGATVTDFEAVLVARDGRRIVTRGHSTPRWDNGVIVGKYDIFRDLTDQRRAEELRSRLVTTLESSPDFVGITTQRGTLSFLNRAGRKLVGIAADMDASLFDLGAFCPQLEGDRIVNEIIPHAVREGSWQGDSFLIGWNDELVPVSLVVVAHPATHEDEPPFLSVVARDLRERVRAEFALVQAKVEAERANRAKSDLLSRASHELRTPLNSVIGFSSVLLRNRGGTFGVGDLNFLERIRSNGAHLLSLVDDILDLSKAEAGRMTTDLASVSLGDLVRDVLASLEGRVLQKQIALRALIPEGLAPISTDTAKLRQVLINLVGNSIKFTSAGGVTVEVIGDEHSRPRSLIVQDTGCGISTEDLPRIFEPFAQGELARLTGEAGSGLGLTISRSFCELLGYRLRTESEVGVGTRMIIDLRAG